jgi:hypothetical protein
MVVVPRDSIRQPAVLKVFRDGLVVDQMTEQLSVVMLQSQRWT